MKPDKFKILVNAYLDKRISREDLQRLLKEISQNPAQRKLFEEYCRLHRGVALALTPQRRKKSRVPYLFQRYTSQTVAAAMLLLFGLSSYLFLKDKNTTPPANAGELAATTLSPQYPSRTTSGRNYGTLTAAPFQPASLSLRHQIQVEKEWKDPNFNLPVRFENLPVDRFKPAELQPFQPSDTYQDLYY